MVSIKGYINTGIKLSNSFSCLAIPTMEEESESTTEPPAMEEESESTTGPPAMEEESESTTEPPAMEEESESTTGPPAMEEESKSTTVPNWLDLPSDLTLNILKRLDILTILTEVCLVCTQWLKICKNPLMWRTIHMPKYMDVNPGDIGKICCNAVKLSCGHLESIIIDDDYAIDDLFKCIADK